MTRLDATFLHDPDLIAVLDTLTQGGHRAFLVGGCVRDALLDRPVGDIDLATDAPPETTTRLARAAGLRTIPTGIDHGTVTVISGEKTFEVTTFRRDEETDGRHAVVTFSDRLDDDARRRDFTMNALYADRDGQVIDPTGGLSDLRNHHLRFVGQARARIKEDYLRILRFFRFFAWYGQDADPDALQACAAHADGLAQISKERIGAEMRKLLSAPDPAPSVRLMAETGVLDRILPGADADRLIALIAIEGDTPAFWPRRLAALSAPDAAVNLRLSRQESRRQQRWSTAFEKDWGLGEAGYRMGEGAAVDYALLRAAAGQALPQGWRDRIARAAHAPLPIAAQDLQPALHGPALGVGLSAAEQAWIDGDFAVPAPTLIDTALLAGSESE